MRVAMFSSESLHSINTGGLHVTKLAAGLQRRGHDVHVHPAQRSAPLRLHRRRALPPRRSWLERQLRGVHGLYVQSHGPPFPRGHVDDRQVRAGTLNSDSKCNTFAQTGRGCCDGKTIRAPEP